MQIIGPRQQQIRISTSDVLQSSSQFEHYISFIGYICWLSFSGVTITGGRTFPPSWPSCLCSAPASAPGARPPPRPCRGQRSKGQRVKRGRGGGGGGAEGTHMHTGNTVCATCRVAWCQGPSSGLSPAWHPISGRRRQPGRDPAHAGVRLQAG